MSMNHNETHVQQVQEAEKLRPKALRDQADHYERLAHQSKFRGDLKSVAVFQSFAKQLREKAKKYEEGSE